PYADQKRRFDDDAAYVGRVEAALPPHAMVFQLPAVAFPEPVGPFLAMDGYAHFRCYLHSKNLRWSHGAMKGRYGDRWQAWVAEKPTEEMVSTLACAGFGGIHVNRSAYPDAGADLEARLARILGSGPLVTSRDGVNSFFGLTAYTDRLRARSTAARWAEQQ